MSFLNGALPEFAPEGGLWLALLRSLVLTGLLSGFGCAVFVRLVLPTAATPALRLGLDRLGRGSAWLGLMALSGWLLAETRLMAGPDAVIAALPTVVGSTQFGHLVVMQMLLLAASLTAVGLRRMRLSLSGAALLLQAGHSHAWSMTPGPSLLLLSDLVHLLAASIWLGGLLPLWLTIRNGPPELAAVASHRFSPLGRGCVAALAVTATLQGWVLIGSVPALVGTAYGWMALVKLGLLATLVGFAWTNQFRLTPALAGTAPGRAQRRLLFSVGLEILVGLAVLFAAALLADLPPGMHEQPVWPFTQAPSLVTIDEDPDFRHEVLLALVALVAALLLAISCWWQRRWWRLLSLAAAAGIAALAVPHLDLLLVEAYPTSFFRSPTGFAATSIVAGAALYPDHCAACHGASGNGDGVLAASLPVPPADLTAPHLWMHSDGELFWWLAHGIEAPAGGLAMPGFARTLSPDQLWALIDFIRARNHTTTLAAPGFVASCDGTIRDPHALGGMPVALSTGTVVPAPGFVACVATDPAIRAAFRIASGSPDADDFLIDANGWLRAAAAGSFTADQLAQARTPLPRDGTAAPMKMDMAM